MLVMDPNSHIIFQSELDFPFRAQRLRIKIKCHIMTFHDYFRNGFPLERDYIIKNIGIYLCLVSRISITI